MRQNPDTATFELDDLLLATPTIDDVASLHYIYSDPRVWTHLPSARHVDISDTEAMVKKWLDGWSRDGLSLWVVKDAASGEVLGSVGCSLRRETYWNLGYRLSVDSQGRGIAKRVSQLAAARAREVRPELPVVAYLLEHNVASARVAEKVGLELRYRGRDAGNPDPAAVRLVYSDRELTPAQLRATML